VEESLFVGERFLPTLRGEIHLVGFASRRNDKKALRTGAPAQKSATENSHLNVTHHAFNNWCRD
jgi:hypothetical protein